MEELMHNANGLEALFRQEWAKCSGIINGIDYMVWNPETDSYIMDNFSIKDFKAGKQLNKKKLCDDFDMDINLPLFIFIGRLVGEKSADLLAPAISRAFEEHGKILNILILGSGEPSVEHALYSLNNKWVGYYNTQISYNEKLSHQKNAGADFLLMPSRVEPCGLNQLYAMRYGTMPLVRKTGGLKDTVPDFGDEGGYGITFIQASVEDITHAMQRAITLYNNQKQLNKLRETMMNVNNSWEQSASKYIDLYSSIL